MNNMRNKILSLLALLITAAAGAWAEESESITTTLPEAKTGSVEFTGTHFKITGQRADKDGMNLGSSTKRTITISALNGEIITKVEMTQSFKFYTWEWEVLSTKGNVSGPYTTGYNLTLTDVDVSEVTLSASNTTTGYLQFNKFKIFYTMPAGTMTLNTDNTVATMTMPANDVTAEYELVRDMSVQMTAQVGDGTQEQPRYRVKKDGNNKFIPADMEMAAVPALFTVNDAIEQKALTQTQDYIVQIYAIDAQGQPTGEAMTFATFTFEPGIYAVKAVAADGSDYDGETALSNTFKLFQGYEVEIAAGEYVTYYKDENLYVEDEDAELYTITSVGSETATAAPLTVAKAYTPILVKNKGAEKKMILLIPTETEGDNVDAAPEFIGTLEATTIAASSENQNNYAFNGLQFVWVKNAIAIGANKAWLAINTGVPSARGITLVFDETTKIANTNITNITNGNWYDLNGRKLDKMPTKKGVYIMNGKKVVVK